MWRPGLGTIIALTVVASSTVAQPRRGGLSGAFEAERRGRFDEAIELYRDALRQQPSSVSALLGLERVLTRADRLSEIRGAIDTALAIQPRNPSIHTLELRVLASTSDIASLDAAAQSWIRIAPRRPEPFREWSNALQSRGDTALAVNALRQGRDVLGGDILAADLGELLVRWGEWVDASEQWTIAVVGNPALLSTAVARLADAPEPFHAPLIDSLSLDNHPVGSAVAAELQLAWSDPEGAWATLAPALPGNRDAAVRVLRRFADRARLGDTPEAAIARGHALEALADRLSGTGASQARVESARAFIDGGQPEMAERVMDRLAREAGDESAGTVSLLIANLASTGDVQGATDRFREWESRLPREEAAALRRTLAWGWIDEGEFPVAESLLAQDSTVEALAVRGWVALFAGDLRSATEYFRGAGPLAGTRGEVTARIQALALVQNIGLDSLPGIGDGFWALRRGDTTEAVTAFARVAGELPPTDGAGDVFAFAGRLAYTTEQDDQARTLLQQGLTADPTGASAATAAYDLARVEIRAGNVGIARSQLVDLIIGHPNSAIVPRARQLLDRLQGNEPGGA